ncbi:hypothetical protein RI367_006013 [Sorochytrium milnesiophthora]
MSQKCPSCSKTVYQTEKVEVKDRWYHKTCFKCSSCNTSLSLRNLATQGEELYCNHHVPKPTHTEVADPLATSHLSSYVDTLEPRSVEGLHKTTISPLEAKSVGVDSMTIQHGMNAPKKVMEGLGYATRGTKEDVRGSQGKLTED